MRPAPAPVRLLAALAVLATVALLGAALPLVGPAAPPGVAAFSLGLMLGGALGGLLAGLLLSGRRWAVRLCLAGSALLGAWLVVQVAVETATGGLDRVGSELALALPPLLALGTTAWMHAAPHEAPPRERPASATWLALGAAALVLGLLPMPWVTGEAERGLFDASVQPWAEYAGLRLTVGATAGALALAAAGALLVARRGSLPVAFAALAFAGAAALALVPFAGVEVCTFEFLSSACLPDPKPLAAPGIAAAVCLVASAYLLLSTRGPSRKA